MLHIETVMVGMIQTNCYIVYEKSPGSCVILDPGGNAEKIIAKLRALSLTPEAILLTHGHFDHILAVDQLREVYRDLEVIAEKEEAVILEDAKMNSSADFFKPVVIHGSRYLEDETVLSFLGCDWQMLHTPGHTIGSCCYYVGAAGVLFSGDTLFQQSYGRTDFATGSMKQIIMSIGGKLMRLPDSTIVYPGHGPATTIEFERAHNICVKVYEKSLETGKQTAD